MKRIGLSVLSALLSITSFAQSNPIVRDIYTADPSAHVWDDGRLYVYPSHDIDPPNGCDRMDKYHVYSTDDMVNWTDHGQILEAADVPWDVPITDASTNATFMWAPDCAYKNGKYYFYFPHPKGPTWNNTWKIGIAVSDKPASGFTVLDYWLKGLPDEGMIDPCIFIDDDGQAYFYYGGGNKCMGAKLKDSMDEIDGSLQTMTGLSDFHEGTWVFKKDNIYYLTYADNAGGANQLRYAISNSPLGPWTYKGVYLKGTTSDTSHGSVVEYKDQWWAFYHTADLSGTGLLRSICVDPLYFNADGTIQTVVQTKDMGKPYKNNLRPVPGIIEAEDYNIGGQGIAYWDNAKGNSGGEYRLSEWVDIARNLRYNTIYVTDTENKEYINYTFDVLEAGIYNVNFTIGSVSVAKEEKFYLEFDQQKTSNPKRYTVPYAKIPDLATITVPNIELTQGIHTVTFYPSGNMDFDKFEFVKSGTGIETIESVALNVYPNPAEGIFHLQTTPGLLRVTDITGKTVLKESVTEAAHTINLSGQAPGVYLLSIQTDNKVIQSKLIKR